VKVQLLYLDSHDDQVSVRDKMGWIKAPRLLVVWPRRGRVLSNRLDLTLVQRQAARRGAQIGLVTFDPDVRDHAQDLGIPVFDSVDSTPESVWRAAAAKATQFEKRQSDRERLADPPDRRSIRTTLPTLWARIQRWSAFVIGVAALAGLAVALGPSATVVVTPQTTIQHSQFQIVLDPEADTLTPDNHIPAERRSLVVSGSLRAPTSGKISVPDSPARGAVVFTNLGQDSISLSKGTGVRADTTGEPRFMTQVSVTLDAGAGSQATVAIQAAQAGMQGNVPAGAIGSIEGPLGLQVAVTNPEPTEGGTESSKPAVTPADLRQLEERLQTQLLDQAAADFSNLVGDGEAWLPPSLKINRTLEKSFDAQVDDVAQSVSLTMKLEVTGLVYHPQTIQAAGLRMLAAQRPHGMATVPGTAIASAVPVDGLPNRLAVTAKESIYGQVPRQELVQSIAGQTPEAVDGLIATHYPDAQVALILRPSWLPRLPWLPTRIDVVTPWEGR
jgi:hypothetical protein